MFTKGQILQQRYQLQDRLDEASLAASARQTWLATEIHDDAQRLVVLKFLQFGGQNQWEALKLFEREVQVLRQLNHPRIPKCGPSFHLQHPEEWMGFVETHIPGQSLQALIGQGVRFSEAEVKAIAHQVLEILMYLHGQTPPILHRDIKPSNLILTPEHQVYLIDFGAVQDRPRPVGQSMTVVGTYGYTPMEQFGGQAEPASDLYALGATLIHLLAGVPPSELVQADLRLQFRDRIQAQPQFANWLDQMTAPALCDRIPSAQQALAALIAPIAPPVVDPPHSRIVLEPTTEALKVAIPALVSFKTMAGLELILAGIVAAGAILVLTPLGLEMCLNALRSLDFAGIGAGLLLSTFGGIFLLVTWNLLKRFLGATQVRLTTQAVVVHQQLLGITYRKQQCQLGSTTQFEALPFGSADTTVIVKPAPQSPTDLISNLTLVEKLSPEEGDWLVQELKQWLHQQRELPSQTP